MNDGHDWAGASLLELKAAAARHLPGHVSVTQLRRLLREAEAAQHLSPGTWLQALRKDVSDTSGSSGSHR